ncbi:MAG: DotA/TraY family protein [Azospirillum sp.]|nr:DotA/TraY family protein [Azospirillum sp.]
MTATIRKFFAAALVALALVGIGIGAAPAEAQVAGQPTQGELQQLVTNNPGESINTLLRWSIPGGDFIAQVIFTIFPTADGIGSATGNTGNGEVKQAAAQASAFASIAGFINVVLCILCVAIALVMGIEWLINVGRTGKWETDGANMWSPLRFGFALIAIVPIPGGAGWNVAQYSLGTLARMGYSGGGMVWNMAVANSTTASRMPIVPPLNPQIPQMVANIGLMEICRGLADGRSYEHFQTPASARVAQWVVEDSSSATRWVTRFDQVLLGQTRVDVTWLSNWISACGSVTLQKGMDPARNGQTSIGYRAHRAAIEEAQNAARTMANTVLTAYFDNKADRDLRIGVAVEQYMSTAPRNYAARLAQTASNILSESINSAASRGRSTAESELAQTARYAGWSNAGAFFMSYSRVATSASQVASTLPDVTPPAWERIRRIYGEGLFDAQIGPAGMLEAYRRNIAHYIDPGAPDWARAGFGGQSGNPNTTNTTSDSSRLLGSGTVIPGATAVNNALMTGIQDLMRLIIDPSYRGANGFNPNAIQSQVEMGHRLMVTGSLMVASTFIKWEAASAAAENAGGAARLIPGLGAVVSALSGAVKGGLTLYFATAVAIGTALIGIGALWAYLIPALIAFFWYAAVLAWIMVLIEAMLVASLAGLANMSNNNEGALFSSKSNHLFSVAFNLTFRPVIMIAGLIISVLVYNIMSSAVSSGIFSYAVPSMLGDSFYGPIGFTVLLMALVIFNLSMIAWLGNLPEVISNNVPSWMGLHPGPQYQSSQAVSQMAGLGTVAGAHQTGGVAGRMVAGAKNLAEAGKEVAKKASGAAGEAKTGDRQATVASTGASVKKE